MKLEVTLSFVKITLELDLELLLLIFAIVFIGVVLIHTSGVNGKNEYLESMPS